MTRRSARASRFFSTLAVLAAVGASSCESCDGGQSSHAGGGGGGGGTTNWLVGRGGLMLNLDPAGRMGRYPLQIHADLLAIACWGATRAWVAGDDGVLLTTEDAGATWRAVDVGSKTRLRAVAIAEEGRVFVAGEEGLLRVSRDGGLTFAVVAAPAVTWTSVAARLDGKAALLTTAGGDIYAYDDVAGTLNVASAAPAGGLSAVALSPDGLTAAAVGEAGAMLVSHDGGRTWRDRPSGTTRTLNDVWLVGDDGATVVAVGEAGVLVSGDTDASDGALPRTLGEDLTFRGVHLEASGHGTIVGDRGTALMTHDFGATWTRVETGESRDLLAVDALGREHEHY